MNNNDEYRYVYVKWASFISWIAVCSFVWDVARIVELARILFIRFQVALFNKFTKFVQWWAFATFHECNAQCIQSITMPIPAQQPSRIYRPSPSCIFIASRVSLNFIHFHVHIRRLSKKKFEWKIMCSPDIHLHLAYTYNVFVVFFTSLHSFFSLLHISLVSFGRRICTGTGTEAASATSRIGIVTCWFIYKNNFWLSHKTPHALASVTRL